MKIFQILLRPPFERSKWRPILIDFRHFNDKIFDKNCLISKNVIKKPEI